MSLESYNEKRDFNISSEPKGNVRNVDKKEEGKQSSIFVIQEHHASHLHWDLRLEMNGVLKSWAVPKMPPTIKGERRLAIQVEDHPIDYASFEGTIPVGTYGAGIVSIWDNGSFLLKEISENKLSFELNGKKMIGGYVLIKTPNMGKNSWLFFKR